MAVNIREDERKLTRQMRISQVLETNAELWIALKEAPCSTIMSMSLQETKDKIIDLYAVLQRAVKENLEEQYFQPLLAYLSTLFNVLRMQWLPEPCHAQRTETYIITE